MVSHCFLEWYSLSPRVGDDVQTDCHCADALTYGGDIPWVSAERSNVVANPYITPISA